MPVGLCHQAQHVGLVRVEHHGGLPLVHAVDAPLHAGAGVERAVAAQGQRPDVLALELGHHRTLAVAAHAVDPAAGAARGVQRAVGPGRQREDVGLFGVEHLNHAALGLEFEDLAVMPRAEIDRPERVAHRRQDVRLARIAQLTKHRRGDEPPVVGDRQALDLPRAEIFVRIQLVPARPDRLRRRRQLRQDQQHDGQGARGAGPSAIPDGYPAGSSERR